MFRKRINGQFKHQNILWIILIIPCFIFFSIIHSFASTQVFLQWDPNSEPDLAGYKVFCREAGKSYDYTHPSWEGTTTYCSVNNLDETKDYYFVARAFDTQGNESGDSTKYIFKQRQHLSIKPRQQMPAWIKPWTKDNWSTWTVLPAMIRTRIR